MKRIRVTALVCGAMLLAAGCDDMSLYPNFLTSVSQIKDVSSHFSASSSSFFFSRVESTSGELLYIGQRLSGGNRKVAVFDSNFVFMNEASSSDLGSMHGPMDADRHLVGLGIYNYNMGTFSSTGVPYPQARDGVMVTNGTDIYLLYGTYYDDAGHVTILQALECINGNFAGATDVVYSVGEQYRYYLLEAGRTADGRILIIFQDSETGKGFVSSNWPPVSFVPPPPGTYISGWSALPVASIGAGTADILDYGEIIAQTSDGDLMRFHTDGSGNWWEGDRVSASTLMSFLIVYGNDNDSMYLFNPGTRQLIKSTAWWRYSK